MPLRATGKQKCAGEDTALCRKPSMRWTRGMRRWQLLHALTSQLRCTSVSRLRSKSHLDYSTPRASLRVSAIALSFGKGRGKGAVHATNSQRGTRRGARRVQRGARRGRRTRDNFDKGRAEGAVRASFPIRAQGETSDELAEEQSRCNRLDATVTQHRRPRCAGSGHVVGGVRCMIGTKCEFGGKSGALSVGDKHLVIESTRGCATRS